MGKEGCVEGEGSVVALLLLWVGDACHAEKYVLVKGLSQPNMGNLFECEKLAETESFLMLDTLECLVR